MCVSREYAEKCNGERGETKICERKDLLSKTDLGGDLLASRASLETVLGTSGNVLEVAHATGTGGLSALSLLTPLVGSDLGSGVTARGADLLLEVEGSGVASSADGVRLGAVERNKLSRR